MSDDAAMYIRRFLLVSVALLSAATFALLVACADESTPGTANPFLPPELATTPDAPPAWLSVLAMGREEEWPGTARPASILKGSLRELGSKDGWSYFVGLGRRGGLCLIAYRPETASSNETRYDGCGSPLRELDTEALWIRYDSQSEKRAAYLLPDGYADAAASLGWGEVIHPNLLVVTDFNAAPKTPTELKSVSVRTLHLGPPFP